MAETPRNTLEQEQQEWSKEFQDLVLTTLDSASYIAQLDQRDMDSTQLDRMNQILHQYFEMPQVSMQILRRKVESGDGIISEMEHPGTRVSFTLQPESSATGVQEVTLDMNIWGGAGIEADTKHFQQGTSMSHEKMQALSDKIADQAHRVSVAIKQKDNKGNIHHVLNFKFQVSRNRVASISSAMLGSAEKPDWTLEPSLVIRSHSADLPPDSDRSKDADRKRSHSVNQRAIQEETAKVIRKGMQLTPKE